MASAKSNEGSFDDALMTKIETDVIGGNAKQQHGEVKQQQWQRGLITITIFCRFPLFRPHFRPHTLFMQGGWYTHPGRGHRSDL